MLADAYNLLRDDVPCGELWHQELFSGVKAAAGVDGILPDKIAVLDQDGGLVHRRRSCLRDDGKLAAHNCLRDILASVKLCFGDTGQIARFVDVQLDVRGAGIVLDTAISVVAEYGHNVSRLHHIVQAQG